MSAAAITSSPSTAPHSSNPLLEVSTVEARSWRALINWKKSTAHGAAVDGAADYVAHQKAIAKSIERRTRKLARENAIGQLELGRLLQDNSR